MCVQSESTARLAALDGLRGLAALAVVAEHLLLCTPMWYIHFRFDEIGAPAPVAALMNSPLHIFWAGEQAVMVFFVLSGFVLTRALRRGGGLLRYYVARSVRLLVPVWASVFVAILASILVPWPTFDSATLLGRAVGKPTFVGTLKDAVLVLGVDRINTPLWSLAWEARFSLVLPIYVWLARPLGVSWWRPPAALLACVAAAPLLGSYVYPLVFAAGVVLAVWWERAEP